MKLISFDQANFEIPTKGGEKVSIFVDGIAQQTLSKWELSDEELTTLQQTKSLYIAEQPNTLATPILDPGFRELTVEEKSNLEKLVKKAKVKEAQAKRNPKHRKLNRG